MNCISRLPFFSLVCLTATCGVTVAENSGPAEANAYRMVFTVTPNPAEGTVDVRLTVRQSAGQLRQIEFPKNGLDALQSDGQLNVGDQTVIWRPDATGGQLEWTVPVSHRRNKNGYDALLGANWGLFRAEDIIPRAKTRALRGAQSKTTLHFDLPSKWSAITEYANTDGHFVVEKKERNYDEPSGWVLLGELGVRREIIAGTRVAIAAPNGQSTRRLDMLALLNWTLPEVERLLKNPMPRLTIVSAMDPMWRGGLSAPASIYIHADRPLISENATSTLLHEVMHVALQLNVASGYDWIAEGLAEYYSLELLKRGGAITAKRYQSAMAHQRQRAKRAESLCRPSSSGATTSLAVTLFSTLDAKIRNVSGNNKNLDTLLERLQGTQKPLDAASLRAIVEQEIGETPDVLHSARLPGCSTL